MDCSPPGSSVHGNSPGKNTGVGSHSLLQGIFPTQGSNPRLQHYRWILYQLSYQGSPRILEWVAYPFSRGSSQPRNRTGVSCIAGGFFTSWATREAPSNLLIPWKYGVGRLVQQKRLEDLHLMTRLATSYLCNPGQVTCSLYNSVDSYKMRGLNLITYKVL